ncbi:hypothetical protein QE373_001101 [Stenotrophomonas sp. SORGH_AS321]|nr:hypothetical protein [Stenotrophomonas sp. SORGH_AS_0321]
MVGGFWQGWEEWEEDGVRVLSLRKRSLTPAFALSPESVRGPGRCLVAPTHGRRIRTGVGRVGGKWGQSPFAAQKESDPCLCSFTGICQGAGRWGWAGALSAMDGAKRGPHGCGFCRPPTSPTARPQARSQRNAATREGGPPVRPTYRAGSSTAAVSTHATIRSPAANTGTTPAVNCENAGSTVTRSRSQKDGNRRGSPGSAASGCR